MNPLAPNPSLSDAADECAVTVSGGDGQLCVSRSSPAKRSGRTHRVRVFGSHRSGGSSALAAALHRYLDANPIAGGRQ